MKMNKLTIVVMAAALSTPFVANAAMINGHQHASVSIPVESFNLETEKGEALFYAKLKSAAKQVCGTSSLREAGSLEQVLQNRVCYKEALTHAVQDVNDAGVSALHNQS